MTRLSRQVARQVARPDCRGSSVTLVELMRTLLLLVMLLLQVLLLRVVFFRVLEHHPAHLQLILLHLHLVKVLHLGSLWEHVGWPCKFRGVGSAGGSIKVHVGGMHHALMHHPVVSVIVSRMGGLGSEGSRRGCHGGGRGVGVGGVQDIVLSCILLLLLLIQHPPMLPTQFSFGLFSDLGSAPYTFSIFVGTEGNSRLFSAH